MSEGSGRIVVQETDGIPVFSVHGYFDQKLGKEINNLVSPFLRSKKVSIILDLAQCGVVNSLGVSQIIELSVKVVEDFKGSMIIANSKPIMKEVFEFADVTRLVQLADSLKQALSLAKSA